MDIKYAQNKYLHISFEIWRYHLNKNPKLKKHKVFCVGFHKTGTTSLEKALSDLGYRMGNQAVGEIIGEDIYDGRYDRLVNYCHTAEAFQDFPFFIPGLYKKLDKEFPDSKFILSVRNDENQWFRSVCRYWTKLHSADKSRLPTEQEIGDFSYRYLGFALNRINYIYPNVKFLDEIAYKKTYSDHNEDAKEYFKDRPTDFLELNVGEPHAYHKLAGFLGMTVGRNKKFPWKNKT